MPLFKTKKALTTALNQLDKTQQIGFVPTMGALHEGHASLIQKATLENDIVVVSIFVNPTQFNNREDLLKYPNTISLDVALIYSILDSCMIFIPAVEEMYENSVSPKSYNLGGLDTVMEGAFRANHFNGVATIVSALLRLVKPHKAYFGEKDYQQLTIIKKLVALEDIPVTIVGCPIIRELNGLAMSSRNEQLSTDIREKAGLIFATLSAVKVKFCTQCVQVISEWVRHIFENEEEFTLEYFVIADVKTLKPIMSNKENKPYRAFVAVYVNGVRLIDNISLN